MLWPVPKSLKEAKFNRSGMTEHKKEDEKEGDEEDGSKGQCNELVDLVLRAYCLALIKACDRINSKVCSEYFHEVSLNTGLRFLSLGRAVGRP